MQRSITTAPTALSRFGAFIEGEHGLVRAFWFDYVLVPNVVYLAIWFFTEPGSTFAVLCVIAWLLYVAAASVAVWRAAGAYTGPSVWRWAARAVVVMPLAGLAIAGVVLLVV